MHDADILRNTLLGIDLNQKDIPEDERHKIEKSVRDVMADIAHDKNINPTNITEESLGKKGLSDDEIRELLKLKHIYNELDSDKPVNPNLLANEIDDVIHDIRKTAEASRIEKSFQNLSGSDIHKLHDADVLRDAL